MYIRIARFDGGDADWDESVSRIRESVVNGGRGTPLEQASAAVQRVVMLVDRENNRGANLVFCESEEDMRRVDDALNQMNPAAGRGARTSVEVYEVAFDEKPGG